MRDKNIFQRIDWSILLTYLMISFIGVAIIFSTEYETGFTLLDGNGVYTKQFYWLMFSLFIGLIVFIIDPKFVINMSMIGYGFTMFLLVLVLLLGKTIAGSTSWLDLGGLRFQPSETAKLGVVLFLAKYLSTKAFRPENFEYQLLTLGGILLPMILILMQGDAGSAIVFVAFFLVLFRSGFPMWWYVIGGGFGGISILTLMFNAIYVILGLIVVIALGLYFTKSFRKMWKFSLLTIIIASFYVGSVDFVFNNVLKPHQQDRINIVLGKDFDPYGIGYNTNQAKIAIGSGGLFGKGYLKGTQTKFDFVPEQKTDFIFCTIGEEFGFAGVAIFFFLFCFLLYRMVSIAERQRSIYSQIFIYGVCAVLFFHFTINIGMVIGILPVVGIPLPFVSYGGSSLLSFSIMIFLTLRLDAERLSVLR